MQALIDEYVASAHPVGSSTLVRRHLAGVSSATVRNELMWLEGRGYVTSPHTSSGRVPTNVGYRSFVNSLLLSHGFLQAFRANSPHGILLHHVAPEGADQLQNIANMLVFLSEHVGCLAVMWAPAISQSVTHRGLAALMSQPEFRETAAALPLIQLLENYGELVALLREVLEISGLHIRIGTENADSQLYSFSMVASRVDIDAHSAVVAVFGPTRMDYRKAIASVSAVVDGYKH